jgi:hypothetical protein
MSASKDFVDSVNEKNRYENFSEEVEILASANAGAMTIYTIKNKNGVTFQKVPGQAGLADRGYMGFVNGDRARPIMLTGSVKTTTTESTNNDVTQGTGGGGSGDINNNFANLFPVDLTPSVAYDIELTASAAGLDDSVETKTGFIIVT